MLDLVEQGFIISKNGYSVQKGRDCYLVISPIYLNGHINEIEFLDFVDPQDAIKEFICLVYGKNQ